MTKLDIAKAKSELDRLVELAKNGEEIIITVKDRPVVKIVPVREEKKPLKFGSAKGKITMSDDFDGPLADFAEYS